MTKRRSAISVSSNKIVEVRRRDGLQYRMRLIINGEHYDKIQDRRQLTSVGHTGRCSDDAFVSNMAIGIRGFFNELTGHARVCSSFQLRDRAEMIV